MSDLALPENRPGLAWVASLPAEWVTPSERLLLLALALDSFNGYTCAPGRDALMSFCGVRHVRTFQRLRDSLTVANEERPALLAADVVKGRHTRYRLQRDSESLTGDDSEPLTGEPEMSAEPDSESLTGSASADMSAEPVSTTCQHDMSAVVDSESLSHPSLPLPTLREGEREGEALAAPPPGGGALTRLTVADVRGIVEAVVPATAIGAGIKCDNPDLADALATAMHNGWDTGRLRAALADMPAPKSSPTGLLIKRMQALAGSDPAAVVLAPVSNVDTATAPGDPLAEQNQKHVATFCRYAGADRQALSDALAELQAEGFVVDFVLRPDDPSIKVHDCALDADWWEVVWQANHSPKDPDNTYNTIYVEVGTDLARCFSDDDVKAWRRIAEEVGGSDLDGEIVHDGATVAALKDYVRQTYPIARAACERQPQAASQPTKAKDKPTYTPADVREVLGDGPDPADIYHPPSTGSQSARNDPRRNTRARTPGFDQAVRESDDAERQRQAAALARLANPQPEEATDDW